MRKKIVFTKNPATLPEEIHECLKNEAGSYLATQLQNHKDARAAIETTLRSSLSAATHKAQSIAAFHAHHVGRLNAGYTTVEALRSQLEKHLDTYYKKRIPPAWGPFKQDVLVKVAASTPNKYDVKCTIVKSAATCNVGTLLVDDARFILSELQPKDALNLVYLRSDRAPREYIGYKHGQEQLYVRRYVIRGLNQDDSSQLTAEKDLMAVQQSMEIVENEIASTRHKGRFTSPSGPASLTLGSQILSHTRGWSKRFVSTTLTHKKIVSTQKKEFRSLFGAILIDLAYVDPATIFDIHTPSSVQRYGLLRDDLIKVPSTKPSDQRTLEDERQLAVLDTVRTREVLIKGAVPYSAVRHKNCGSFVVGLYDNRSPYLAELRFNDVVSSWEAGTIVNTDSERLPYIYKGYQWKFFLFSDAATANKALSVANSLISKKTGPNNAGAKLFDVFSFPDTLPPGSQ